MPSVGLFEDFFFLEQREICWNQSQTENIFLQRCLEQNSNPVTASELQNLNRLRLIKL